MSELSVETSVWAYSADTGPRAGEVAEVNREPGSGRILFVRVLDAESSCIECYSARNIYLRPQGREALIMRIQNDFDNLSEWAHRIADSCKKCGLPPGCPDCKGVHDYGPD